MNNTSRAGVSHFSRSSSRKSHRVLAPGCALFSLSLCSFTGRPGEPVGSPRRVTRLNSCHAFCVARWLRAGLTPVLSCAVAEDMDGRKRFTENRKHHLLQLPARSHLLCAAPGRGSHLNNGCQVGSVGRVRLSKLNTRSRGKPDQL